MRFPLLASLALLALPACSSNNDGYATYYDDTDTEPSTVDVLLDQGVTTDAGTGVALNVSAAAGGGWRIETTCDTPDSGLTCFWDLVVSVPKDAGDLDVSDDSAFSGSDQTIRVDSGSLRVYFETSDELDFVELSGPDGADLTVDVLLDGARDSTVKGFVNWWQSETTLRQGAPSNPVTFHPIQP